MPPTGISLGEEASSVAPSLLTSSSFNQSQPPPGGSPPGGLPSPSFGSLESALYRIQSFVPTLLSPRSQLSEGSKLKEQSWRKNLFHFLACFVIGIFVGFIQFISWDLSKNLTSVHKSFFFEVFQPVGEVQLNHIWPRNVTMFKEKSGVNDNSTILNESSNQDSDMKVHKLLIIVTPTYAHPFQEYYLNRLVHTLRLVSPPVLWIVVEMNTQSVRTANLLRRTGVVYRHLICTKNMTEIKDKSVHQRNVALYYIEIHRLDGIVYFADEDNIYSTDIFEQMRLIWRFGTWPVAKVTQNESQALLDGPTCKGPRVTGWRRNEGNIFRRFHVDMSGFAFNSTILWDPVKWDRSTIEPIRHRDATEKDIQASTFIEQVVMDESEMKGLPKNCKKIMVWHPHIEISYSPRRLLENNFYTLLPLASKFEAM